MAGFCHWIVETPRYALDRAETRTGSGPEPPEPDQYIERLTSMHRRVGRVGRGDFRHSQLHRRQHRQLLRIQRQQQTRDGDTIGYRTNANSTSVISTSLQSGHGACH